MTTVSEIPVVELPAFDAEGRGVGGVPNPPASVWAVDVPRGRRPSPLTLAVLGILAGLAALGLGIAAVISTARSTETSPAAGVPATAAAAVTPSAADVERRALALLAKPSTERIAFTGAHGLVLAVGSGGRAAILVRGLERASSGTPYIAWIVPAAAQPVRAARFAGSERAVFLARRLGPRSSVVVSAGRPALPLTRNRIVAIRG